MRASSSPASTAWPGLTRTSATVPVRGEPISFSIFMASMTRRPWPRSTLAPGSTRTATTLPGIAARSSRAPSLAPVRWWRRRARSSRRRRRGAGGAGPSPPGGGPAAGDGGQRGADEGQVGLRPLGQRRGLEVAGDEAGVDVAGAEGGVPEGPAVEGDVGGRTDDHVLAEGAQHAADRLVPGGAPGDQLGEDRVVVGRDLEALVHARVVADADPP